MRQEKPGVGVLARLGKGKHCDSQILVGMSSLQSGEGLVEAAQAGVQVGPSQTVVVHLTSLAQVCQERPKLFES